MDSSRRKAPGTPKSPAQLGNLTGPARVLNDVVVSFYNTIQKWNGAYLQGVSVIQSIKTRDGNEDRFQSSCEKLGGLVDVMRLQLIQMQSYCLKLKNLRALNDTISKIGVSWTFENFVESAEALSRAYLVETERKEKVAILCKEYSPDSKEFEALSVAWTQLVSIGPDEEMLLKAANYEANLGSPWEL